MFGVASIKATAQPVTIPSIDAKQLPPINTALNRIWGGDLDSFYNKLKQLKQGSNKVVRIVHIGDSHIQADFLSGEIRSGLQQAFGNAGRGLVFPYQVARTNPPQDIFSSSDNIWQSNRLIRTTDSVACGISGFCIQCKRTGAAFTLTLQNSPGDTLSFNSMDLFTDSIAGTSWLIKAGENKLYFAGRDTSSVLPLTVNLPLPATSFTLTSLLPDTLRSFYGVSLQRNTPGILYHTIGVNGAKYQHYNNTPLFWRQLPALQADLFIVSMGTNEAQALRFDEPAFLYEVDQLVQKLKSASPGAAIIITTAADSYKGRYPNKVLQQLNTSLYKYCAAKQIALWDLYRATNGYGAARHWVRLGLMQPDKIHFKSAGYRIMGDLFLQALLNGYNRFVSN